MSKSIVFTKELLAEIRDNLPFKDNFWEEFANLSGTTVSYLFQLFNGETALGNTKEYPTTIKQRRILLTAYLLRKHYEQMKTEIETWDDNQKRDYLNEGNQAA